MTEKSSSIYYTKYGKVILSFDKHGSKRMFFCKKNQDNKDAIEIGPLVGSVLSMNNVKILDVDDKKMIYNIPTMALDAILATGIRITFVSIAFGKRLVMADVLKNRERYTKNGIISFIY